MTPHELMDLPYAGMAEKQLRKQGDWRLTKEERLEKYMDGLDNALDEARQYFDDVYTALESNT